MREDRSVREEHPVETQKRRAKAMELAIMTAARFPTVEWTMQTLRETAEEIDYYIKNGAVQING